MRAALIHSHFGLNELAEILATAILRLHLRQALNCSDQSEHAETSLEVSPETVLSVHNDG